MEENSLKEIKNYINKRRGTDIMGTGEGKTIKRIPSGSYTLDAITGGIPLGRFSYFYGNPMSGKTSLALTTIANAQKEGLLCAFLDAEKTYSSDWAEQLGVDVNNLLVASYSLGEPIADTLIDLIEKRLDLIVVDSIAAICPEAFLKGSSKGKSYAGLAHIINPMVCTANAINTKTGVIFINQPRDKIGSFIGGMSLPGGKALAHYSSLSIKFWVSKRIKDKKSDVIGREITCNVDKNKLGAAENNATFNIYFNKGIDNTDELLTLALEQGIVKKKGSWYKYNEEEYQGRSTFTSSANPKWKEEVSL
jgi:recombination protein RecA